MSDEPVYMTREGKAQLEAKLDHLIKVERKHVAERIHAAKELGDISESGEYEDAKKSQALLEGEIREITSMLSRAQLIDEGSVNGSKEVRIGSRVTLRFETEDEEEELTIVGRAEVAPRDGRISNESPIGKAILGKKVNEKASFDTPTGPQKVTIIKIH